MKKMFYFNNRLLLLLVLLLSLMSWGCQTTTIPANSLNLWDSGPITLDPAVSGELSSHTYIMQIFSGLVYLDEKLDVKPDIAESWQMSGDGKVYTFNIRKGVFFHDGREVTAEDFKYSWERACAPRTMSSTAAIYLNDIVGTDAVLQGKSATISGIEVIDKYKLKVTIYSPKTYFIQKMAYPTAFVVDRSNVESSRDWWHQPNGTGPFKLKEWSEGQLIVLEANSNFYRVIPRLKTINFHLLAGNPIDLYEMNEIDVAPIDQTYIYRAKDTKGPFAQELNVFPQLSFTYIGFNISKPPFDDINIRQAFCYATNKNKIIQVILKDTATNANSIIPPGMPGYNANLGGFEYNIDKAKALIASSKYQRAENIPPIKFTISGLGGYIPDYIGALIQDWKNNLGVNISVRQLEPEIFLYRLKDEADEMFYLGWIADYPDPQDFLENLFSTDYFYNTGKYSNPQVDSFLEKAAAEPDTTKRLNIYKQAEEIIVKDAACIPLWFETEFVLIKPYVKNLSINPLGIPTLSNVYIER